MILIVEDEALFSQSIAEMLDGFGKKIIITTDGDQALEKIEKYHYSLAIIDLVLPGPMNGLEVIKKIKVHTPSTKVIAISGYGNQSLIQKSYKAGADVFIAKPFKPVDLIDHVENLLFHRKTQAVPQGPQATTSTPPSPPEPVKPAPPVQQPEPVKTPPPPKPQPVEKPSQRLDTSTVPLIFKNFPQSALVDLVKFGKIIRMNPGQRLKVNYSEYIVVSVAGSVTCYQDRHEIGTLGLNESIGQESLTRDISPVHKVVIEAKVQAKLFLISKVQLIRYLSNNSDNLLNIFKTNLKQTLKNNIILKAEKEQKPPSQSSAMPTATGQLPTPQQTPPHSPSQPPDDPDIDIDLDQDSLDLLGI